MSEEKTVQSIIQILSELYPNGASLHEPYFNGNEWDYVKECIDTRWVSSVGKYVDQFEEKLAQFTGCKKAVVVSNGTVALQVALQLSGVKKDDEVLMPALSFVATANAASYLSASPHFVDSDVKTLGVCPEKLEAHLNETLEQKGNESFNKKTGRRVSALVPMHTYGCPVDLDPLVEICKKYHLALVEDAAESLGSSYRGRHTGGIGLISAMSFNGNKIMTTGGGGAILTQDEKLGTLAKHLTTTAKQPHAWEYFHDQVGYNFRMPNLNAAMGCAQLEQVDSFLEKKRTLAQKYANLFEPIEGANMFKEPEFAKSNYWLNALLLDLSSDDANETAKNQVLEMTNQNKIQTRPAWKLLSELPMYQSCPQAELETARGLAKRIVCLPSSVFL